MAAVSAAARRAVRLVWTTPGDKAMAIYVDSCAAQERPRWTAQNRPLIDRSKPATIWRAAETSEFYFVASSVRKSVWTLVRQLRGPHLSTCA